MMKDLGVSIVADVIVLIFIKLLRYVQQRLEKKNPRGRPVLYYGAWAIWLIVNSFAYYLVESERLRANVWVFATLLPTSIVLFYISWCAIRPFWSVGLRSVDRRIDKGIDYRTSLSLVQKELSFLGTGASKLTALTQEFEDALARCQQERPIRFLLMKPSDEDLRKAAQRAGRDRDAYKKQVLESLRRIATIRKDRGLWNIEVGFYPESQLEWGIPSVFRLMFIDRSLCLMSYNAFGISDGRQPGSELPQLHLVSSGADETASGSFYWAMERFYDLLWKRAEKWNFEDYLNG